MSLRLPLRRICAGSVSGRKSVVATSSTSPVTARTTNVPRQLVIRRICPPPNGARMGTSPVIIMSRDRNRDTSAPSNRSRTTARVTTRLAAAMAPCRKRATSSTTTLGDQAHATVVRAQASSPSWRGRRRPMASDTGPTTDLPHGDPDQVRREGPLHRPGAAPEVASHLGEGGQVQVGHQRAVRRQGAEEQDESRPPHDMVGRLPPTRTTGWEGVQPHSVCVTFFSPRGESGS